ncbi:3309_t:CDS:1, partial [Acaulospora morrowiae]
KTYNLDQYLALQKLYYYLKDFYQNIKEIWDAFKKAGYTFLFID